MSLAGVWRETRTVNNRPHARQAGSNRVDKLLPGMSAPVSDADRAIETKE